MQVSDFFGMLGLCQSPCVDDVVDDHLVISTQSFTSHDQDVSGNLFFLFRYVIFFTVLFSWLFFFSFCNLCLGSSLPSFKVPAIGDVYFNEDVAIDYYKCYAHTVGFSVRKDRRQVWKNTNLTKFRDLVCSKSGWKRGEEIKKMKNTIATRSGCTSMIRLFVAEDGKCTVRLFTEAHTHDLVPREMSHLLRSNRFLSKEHGQQIMNMDSSGIGVARSFPYLCKEAGGRENIHLSKRQLYNFVRKERAKHVESGDAMSVLEEFRKRASIDPFFFYAVKLDSDGRLANFFWSDSHSREDFARYGDVVTFDTTYKTNKYNLSCGLFIGVNNHWQNILLGCCFLSGETIEDFEWAFSSFKESVYNKEPISIFTDGDRAMAAAIPIVFPTSRHHLCSWHLSQNACSNCPKMMQVFFFVFLIFY